MTQLQTPMLMAVRGDEDAEPVLVEVDGREAVFVLDDGERLVFDATELRAALRVNAPL